MKTAKPKLHTTFVMVEKCSQCHMNGARTKSFNLRLGQSWHMTPKRDDDNFFKNNHTDSRDQCSIAHIDR